MHYYCVACVCVRLRRTPVLQQLAYRCFSTSPHFRATWRHRRSFHPTGLPESQRARWNRCSSGARGNICDRMRHKIPVLRMPYDYVVPHRVFEQRFEVCILERGRVDHLIKEFSSQVGTHLCYTNGSHTGEISSLAGYGIYFPSLARERDPSLARSVPSVPSSRRT